MAGRDGAGALPQIRVPTLATFAGLCAGIAAGLLLQATPAEGPVLAWAEPVGQLWLRALKMTILPLVAGLLFTGIVQAVATANAGAIARRTLVLFLLVLAGSAAIGLLVTPALLSVFPAPERAVAALSVAPADVSTPSPTAEHFVASIMPENVVKAATDGAMLPLIVFLTVFALATTRLTEPHRGALARLFEALAGAMMVVIGWVLWAAPFGVFALALGLAASSGTAAIATLLHYILIVSASGLAVAAGAYALAALFGRQSPGRFARAMLPSQAVAVSTQSSLASLPAMIASCRRLGLRDSSDEFVLPLAVALFRATSPAMNLAVAYYVARLAGVEPSPAALAAAGAVAVLASLSTVSLPGTVSFIATIAPVAAAMGAPLAPLAILVAVEMLPDIVRTFGNVTTNVAVTSVIDRRFADEPGDQK